MDHHLSKPLRIFLETDRGENEIDLTKASPSEFFRNDLIRHRFTGTLPSGPDYSVVNFVACEMHDISANHIDFSECDFKDSLIKGAEFSNCTFDGGTFATTFFADTEFSGCKFYNLAAYGCDFHQVRFVACDLTNLLVKSSQFSQCTFLNCVTSNKIFEMSTLFDVRFENTPIQLETITNNFGLRLDDLTNTMIRSGRAREEHESLSVQDLKNVLDSHGLSALEGLALEYFLEQSLLNGSLLLDESLNITRWIRIHRNPGSFVELLDGFGEFLTHLYEENQLTLHPILLLHHVTSTLTGSISAGTKLHRVAMSLGGLHLILSRIVEEYLELLQLISELAAGSVTLLAEGPEDRDYFRRELEPWISTGDIEIARVERNSPLIVEFIASNPESLLALIGVFLATRTKLEITRLASSAKKRKKENDNSPQFEGKRSLPAVRSEPKPPVFSLSTGMVKNPNPAYELRMLSVLPGSLLLDLKLNFSTTVVSRLRGILLNLLDDSSVKRS
jgi:uncharacterized protein YjbI with pentapeptide repeats